MKKIFFVAIAAAAMMASCSSKDSSLTAGGSKQLDSLSYALGSNIAYMIKYNLGDMDLNYDKLCAAIDDAARSKEKVSSEDAFEQLNNFFSSYSPQDSIAFTSEAQRDSISYAYGVYHASSIVEAKIPAQTKWLCKALNDVKAGEGQFDEQTTMGVIQHYMIEVMPMEALKRSEEFLAGIEKQSGWKRTDSGLLYKIETEGSATERATQPTDRVKVHYKGLNIDGEQFDSSYDRDEPAEFALNQVIKGWSEGVQLIGKGGKIKMWLHPDLAYGPRAMSPEIGPNAALYFEVELLEIMPDTTALQPVVDVEAAEAQPETAE